MSGMSSSFDSDSKVYYLDKNALPKNFIEKGFKLSPSADPLSVDLSVGSADISGCYQETTETTSMSLTPRSANLMYLKGSDYSDCPQIGVVSAKYPIDMIDNNTVGFWIPNKAGNIPNLAVGKSSIAVANDLVPTGGLTVVDGHCDYAIKGDGATGYLVSQNSMGFPSGINPTFEFSQLITVNSLGSNKYLWNLNGANMYYGFIGSTGEICYQSASTLYYTNFITETGKTYIVKWRFINGTTLELYINGVKVYSTSIIMAGTITNLILLAYGGGAGFSNVTLHYIDLRNALYAPQQISAISNALLLPCSYTKPLATYPTISPADLSSAYHEYKFDETSGTGVADSAGTLNGTATGTTIVDSEIGLGKTRKWSVNTDKILCGSVALPSVYTMIFAGNLANYTTQRTLFSNRNSAGTTGNMVYIDAFGKVRYISATSSVDVSNSATPTGKPMFIALAINGVQGTLYQESPTPSITLALPAPDTILSPLYIGNDQNSGYAFNGIIDYFLIVPRALSQAEIAQYYNALMKTGQSDIREVLPANSISLGYTKTSSTAVIEIDTKKRKYGRVEGATGGNRIADREWKYVTTGITKDFDNPFATENVTVSEIWFKKNLTDSKHSVIDATWATGYYGCFIKNINAFNIQIQTSDIAILANVNSYTGVSEGSGYIALGKAEIIE